MRLDESEMELAARRGLTEYDIKTATLIMSNSTIFPLRYFPRHIVEFVAEVRERQQCNAKRFSNEIST